MENKIEELIEKYNAGLTDPSEVSQLEKLIEEGHVDLTKLRDLERLDNQFNAIEAPATSLTLDDKFYAMLGKEKKKAETSSFSFSMPSWDWLAPRLAFATVLVIAGFTGGYFFNGSNNSDVKLLTQQVADLKETMMLSLLEKESATDRLKAVSLSTEMDHVSTQVTAALFKTLNSDPSVNVRLAALEAITPYAKVEKVREQLVRSIAKQDSPLVQVALAELMGQIQEKKSVTEFDKILKDKNTPEDIKKRIKDNLNVLI
ncbi:MAG: HEAT repeat domain-containing protein [Bacteroidota bacterium]